MQVVQATLDALMKERLKQGLGLVKRQTEVITAEMENVLWERELLGDHDPITLLSTVFYVLGLHLSLRGREEHRHLRHLPSQLSVKTDGNGRRYIEYKEDVSEANSCGLHSSRQVGFVIFCSAY